MLTREDDLSPNQDQVPVLERFIRSFFVVVYYVELSG